MVQLPDRRQGEPRVDLFSSLTAARENARTLREILPTEAWELLNEFFAEFSKDLAAGINKRTRFDFLKRVVVTLQTIAGMLDGTMNRNDAHTFSTLGRNLERADMTSRIVDVRSAQLLPAETPELRPFETVQWMSVLKSLSGYQMYRLQHAHAREAHRRAPVPAARRPVPALLPVLPHAARKLAQRRCRAAKVCSKCWTAPRRFIQRAPLATLDQPGLHELIDNIQLHITNVHNMIAEIYFPPRRERRAPHAQPDADPGQSQTQRQSSLSFGEPAKA